MYRRAIVVLISILTCCAFMCVGFSAWSISAEPQTGADTSGVISSEPVIYSNDYVWIDENEMIELNKQSFVVSPYGFVHENDGTKTINTTGELQIPLVIDKEKCEKFFTADTINVSVTVSFKNSRLYYLWIQQYFTSTYTYKGNDNENKTITVSGKGDSSSGYTMSFTFNLKDIADNTITLKLTIDTISVSNYQSLFYNLITENDVITNPFVFVVMVSDKTGA